MKSKIFIKLLLVIAIAFLLRQENEHLYFGKAIYSVFPCGQNPENSFPCYANWDIALLAIGFILCICLLISAIIDFKKKQ
ncbi:MAG: hypothetical protein WCX74_00865 [Candidatus Paceibacterota bacterium]